MEKVDGMAGRLTPRLGIWQEIPSPSVSRYLAAMGWDFVVLDMQHGAMTSETAYQCIHILRAMGVEPWVRVSIGAAAEIQRALDWGAQCIAVPMVNTAADAHAAAQCAKYPPLGVRSVGGDFATHQGHDYPERANRETRLLVQVEHLDAVQNIDEILSTPGVDGVFVGPTDLALSMGLQRNGFANDLRHKEALQLTLEATLASGKAACCNSYSMTDAAERFSQRWHCVTFRSDVDLLMSSGRDLLSELRQAASTSSMPQNVVAKSRVTLE
ncbi:MAG TPA: aldolase/citrate lyase family protein [Lacipirellulaceae bacterium]|nr:aldolase/citrate lyase family protein [Lacipirellulaceae bacterium]